MTRFKKRIRFEPKVMPAAAPSFYELPPVAAKTVNISQELISKPKILTHNPTGRRFFVAAGLSWAEIVEKVCQDKTNPKSLYHVARGTQKTANGWTIEFVEGQED